MATTNRLRQVLEERFRVDELAGSGALALTAPRARGAYAPQITVRGAP